MREERSEVRSWLAEALSRRPRHPALEDTLFRRLQEFERGPLEQLGELVHNVIEELRVAQRRLAEQAGDLRALQHTVATLNDRLDDLSGRVAAAPQPPAEGHLLLLGSADGYRLVERDGPPPAAGERVELDDGGFVVLREGRSPLPGDRRRCAVALPATS
jgi:hypothetical protein